MGINCQTCVTSINDPLELGRWFASLEMQQCRDRRQSGSRLIAMCNKKLQIGQKAPSFEAPAIVRNQLKTISLDSFKGNCYLVLFFYPADL